MKHIVVVAAIIKYGDKILCVQRNAGKHKVELKSLDWADADLPIVDKLMSKSLHL